ncbi:hypothetical protein DMC30DRAFT_418563 [Rhodotorula diobovata]|uniref:Large ribosomal subunit protein uL30-like ferredoxin-like fold domain-containing protein n=1 Tax=Rhodotorula diobovata TaxID=5288 RepID=A0A5C5FQY3_9BASI|nr:hypothetical protein DMC30DRAFT_418563 [Rhodotorula diobovata]
MLRSCTSATTRALYTTRPAGPSSSSALPLLRAHLHSSTPAPRPAPTTAAPALAQGQPSTSQASTSRAGPPPPTTTTTSAASSSPSHFLVTLLRSPLHLGASQRASAASLGLHKRLSSSIVPITPQSAGYVLALKELVGVRRVSRDEVAAWGSREWRERPGEGRKGSGLRVKAEADEGSVIRVGSERARGDERGFRVVARP